MRVFIAIELSEEIKEYLQVKQQMAKIHSTKGNFSDPDNFHITLRFIGEVEEEEIEKLKKAIDRTASKNSPFSLQLGQMGWFERGNKKILWVGLQKQYKQLESLVKDLEQSLEEQGYEREDKVFRPHITLGRELVMEKALDFLQREIPIEPKEIYVKKIALMHSTRVNGKLKYIPIYIRHFQENS